MTYLHLLHPSIASYLPCHSILKNSKIRTVLSDNLIVCIYWHQEFHETKKILKTIIFHNKMRRYKYKCIENKCIENKCIENKCIENKCTKK